MMWGIYNSTQREVFNDIAKSRQPIEKPFLIKNNGFNIIIDDSNLNGDFLKRISSLIKEKSLIENLIIIRHHVPIKELDYAKNVLRKADNRNIDSFEETFSNFKSVTLIYGDGGAHPKLPRIACFSHNNIFHIVNGIGEEPNDKVLILNNGLLTTHTPN